MSLRANDGLIICRLGGAAGEGEGEEEESRGEERESHGKEAQVRMVSNASKSTHKSTHGTRLVE